jgi:hypothetical protein
MTKEGALVATPTISPIDPSAKSGQPATLVPISAKIIVAGNSAFHPLLVVRAGRIGANLFAPFASINKNVVDSQSMIATIVRTTIREIRMESCPTVIMTDPRSG